MKSRLFRYIKTLILIAVSLLIALSSCCAEIRLLPSSEALAYFGVAAEPDTSTADSLRLPASLRVIGEEAFAGTAASAVYLADGVLRVESRAFACMPEIRLVSIPQSAEQIAEDAFEGAAGLAVYGAAGSAAQIWAGRVGYVFIIRNLWTKTALRRAASEFLMLLLMAALICGLFSLPTLRKRRRKISLAEHQSMLYRKRAELFALDLCFP